MATTTIPPALASVMDSLPASQQELAKSLCDNGQAHLFEEATSVSLLLSQLERMDESYADGGLVGYVRNARRLLENSRQGVNPLQGWKPSVPIGQTLQVGTADYDEMEASGRSELGKVGFVLVAGGLGERLGYSGIKINLPTELATETSYIKLYIDTILAYQARHFEGSKLPLCIMTSNDTNAKTVALLEANSYFGMSKDQITIVQQGMGVPALQDNDAKMALDETDPSRVLAKPHGHGDIHALLYTHQVAKTWLEKHKIQWIIFFQDTNGLAFHTLPVAIGISIKYDLIMNSIATPRKAKQAIGGIAKLVNEELKVERTVNVEYNQLDPLLRSTTEYPEGDVNDPTTGYSPFPGNINQLLFRLEPYVRVLDETQGIMPEFVNPKYKDAEKTIFKKPTRLECMMQDFPTVLQGTDAQRVGFTSIAAEMCFSPVKNATADGVAMQAKGVHPGVAATGEADQYGAFRIMLQTLGCHVQVLDKVAEFQGIRASLSPDIVLRPSFCTCLGELREKIPDASAISISAKSSLVISGQNIVLKRLDLDGALVIRAEEGAPPLVIDQTVHNGGWEKVADKSSTDEVIVMRGYRMEKHETKFIIARADGTVEGL